MKTGNWRKWGIAGRLWVAFGFLILILILSAVVSYWQISNADKKLSQVMQVHVPLEQATLQMKTSAQQATQAVLNYSQDRDSKDIENLSTYDDQFEKAFTRFLLLIDEDDLKLFGQEAARLYEESDRLRLDILRLIDQQDLGLQVFREDIEDISALTNQTLRAAIDATAPDAAIRTGSALGMEKTIAELSCATEIYVAEPNPGLEKALLDAKSDFQGFLKMYRETGPSGYEESWLTKIDKDFNEVTTDSVKIVAMTDNLNSSLAQFERNLGGINTLLDENILPLIIPEVVEAEQAATSSMDTARTWVIPLGVVGLVVGGCLAFFISRRITKSLQGLLVGAKKVADSKLDHRFYIDSKDEFGDVAMALNQMLDHLGRSREALGESEETAWQLLDATTDYVILTDARGIILASNELAAEKFGMSLEQMIDTSFYDLLPADTMASRKAQIAEVIRSGKPLHFEDERDGMIYDQRLFPAFDAKTGRVTRVAIFTRDITTRKWVEEVTEQLGRRNELILEAAGEGIYGLDTQGKTTFVNPAAARMLGYKSEDLIGQRHHELVHHSRPNGMPYPHQECPIYGAFKDGKIRTSVDAEVFWRKDGTSFPVEYTSTPIIDNGQIVGAVVTFQDITERKRVEKALKQSEERYRSILESAATFIVSVDKEGVVVDCNARAKHVLGYTPDEIIGCSLVDLIHPDDRKEAQADLVETVNKGYSYNNQYKVTRKDDTIVEINLNAATVSNQAGEYVRTICMIYTMPEHVQA